MSKKKEQRCKACKRIIMGESKTGICPECARKGKNMAIGFFGIMGGVVLKCMMDKKEKFSCSFSCEGKVENGKSDTIVYRKNFTLSERGVNYPIGT